jgi:glycosyltransferase involved in cell wall biosynthesis
LRIVVVVPCRNDAVLLDACLSALDAQTRRADGVVVVDNGSSDDSVAVARRHGVAVSEEPRVGIWPAAAHGYDRALPDADVIARLDADSRPHPDWFSRIERAFTEDAGLGVLTGGAEFYGIGRLGAYLGEHWYIGGGRVWVKLWLGIPLMFGSNFAMRASIWQRERTRVQRDNPGIHDDLDLTIHLRASDGVRWDRTLRMPVSARPLTSARGLVRRVWRVLPTFASSWPEGRFRAAVRDDPAETDWADGEELSPRYGR